MQGPEEHYALGEEVARTIWAPVMRSHRVTVEQMALLEPGLSETVVASLLDVMREAMDEVVARGVPAEAARDFLLGHMNILGAVIFKEQPGVFSDACNKAIQFGKPMLMRDDWKTGLRARGNRRLDPRITSSAPHFSSSRLTGILPCGKRMPRSPGMTRRWLLSKETLALAAPLVLKAASRECGMLEFLQSLTTGEALWALGQVIMIDLVLAGDNAVVIGLAAAGLPKDQRNKAILVGIIAATVLRIVFASITTQLLQVLGLHAGRRHPAALGVLEDVARAARRPCARKRASKP